MKPDLRHFPVRTDTTLGKATHYVARCGYESDDGKEFVTPWSYKPEQVMCEGCQEGEKEEVNDR